MYCVNCGVKLADTEKKCPLCETAVYHPDLARGKAEALFPEDKMPKRGSLRALLCGAVIILFMIPMVTTLLSDVRRDGELDWFGYVAGGLLLAYIVLALPLWFKKPNPVIFVPCDFAAAALYLLYVSIATGGGWYLTFALPIVGGSAIIACTFVTLTHYLKRGKLYVLGGSVMALGVLTVVIELLIDLTFTLPFIGWSLYPLISMLLVGGLLIYLAISGTAREWLERLLFF